MIHHHYEAVIGLEVHAQLSTASKIFCSCPAKPKAGKNVGEEIPNANTCPVCTGQPGALPVLNRKVVEYAVMAGLSLECQIRERSVFARKNYFYPDLPKGYQISQYDQPLCENGFLEIAVPSGIRRIGIKRIHLEEDAGKNIHLGGYSLINLNRAGVPLVEIVSDPDLRSAEEAGAYLRELHAILTFLNICDGNLQEGNFRCDANVSVRLKGEEKLGTRTEIKNVNSFRFIEDAIDFEIRRQVETLKAGKRVHQETRGYDPSRHATVVLRSKEEAEDYRYFPDPDLMPLTLPEGMASRLKAGLPELPRQRRSRYAREFGLSATDAWSMTASRDISHYYDRCLEESSSLGMEPRVASKALANWISGEVMRMVNESKLDFASLPLSPQALARIVKMTVDGVVSSSGAKQVLGRVWNTQEPPEEALQNEGLAQVNDADEVEKTVEKIIAASPDQVAEYKAGKQKVLVYLVGQVMKESRGRANPSLAQEILRKKLSS